MQTIKTGIVVALLLAVCYGAFVALNAPAPDLPPNIDQWISGEDEFEQLLGFESEMASLDSAVPVSAEDFLSEVGQTDDAAANMPSLQGANQEAGANSNVAIPSLPSMDLGSSASQGSGTQGSGAPAFPALPTQPTDNSNSSGFPSPQGLSGFPALDAGQVDAPSLGGLPQLPMPGGSSGQGLDMTVGNSNSPPSMPSDMAGEPAGLGDGGLIPPMFDTNNTSPPGQPVSTDLPPSNVGDTAGLPTMDFPVAREQALTLAKQGELTDALRLLTGYYGSPALGYEQSSDLIDILDGLAKEVVYSERHMLEPAYVIRQVDSLESVAKTHGLNPQFLAAINRLGDARALIPGSSLKVVKGPFRASVNTSQNEMTVFLGDLYAGRFPVSFGKEPSPRAGTFEVVDRQTNRTYYGASSNVLKAKDPRNPYGGYWLDLGEDLCIHGTAEMISTDLENAGCISLAPIDARDVFNILIVGSQVEIVD